MWQNAPFFIKAKGRRVHNGLERLSADEIDLVVFFRQLWKGRVTILLMATLATSLAVAYALWAPPVYRAQAVIAPGALDDFGTLAGQMQARSAQSVAVAIADGRQLVIDSFELLISQLESRAAKAEFDGAQAEVPRDVTLEIKRGRLKGDPVTIVASTTRRGQAGGVLEAYLAFASGRTATELNGFFTGMGLTYEVEPEMLYRLEAPAHEVSSPVHPKRLLIAALGFVLGTMAGAFIVMMRALLARNRALPVIP